jgi:hypothetical protein
MSVIWSWTYFYNLHWNNYLYFKGLLYIWKEMIMMALLHMAVFHSKNICPLLFLTSRKTSALFPFPTSPQYFSLICDPFADPIISFHSRYISFRMHMKNPAQTGSGCIRFSDWKIENATFAEYSCPIRMREPRYLYLNVAVEKRNISGV